MIALSPANHNDYLRTEEEEEKEEEEEEDQIGLRCVIHTTADNGQAESPRSASLPPLPWQSSLQLNLKPIIGKRLSSIPSADNTHNEPYTQEKRKEKKKKEKKRRRKKKSWAVHILNPRQVHFSSGVHPIGIVLTSISGKLDPFPCTSFFVGDVECTHCVMEKSKSKPWLHSFTALILRMSRRQVANHSLIWS